jgi:organic radical activating enzyme
MDYYQNAKEAQKKLKTISGSMCLAKWLQVSLHLPQGQTQSCYHPPTHQIPLDEIKNNPQALHNTREKLKQREMMLKGEKPKGCNYCWATEKEDNMSDRFYKSGEWWAVNEFDNVVDSGVGENIAPTYVEVNFNQACNLKCIYCSPHLSTAWEKEIDEFGPIKFKDGSMHNHIPSLREQKLMPLDVATAENPYVDAFWKWWPELYKTVKVFRMTGGEPLMDKNTFKVLSYVDEHPNNELELSITSNLCPPSQKLFDKFVTQLKKIEEPRTWTDANDNIKTTPACKYFTLYVSVDSIGEQAEYIRAGLDFDILQKNVEHILDNTHSTIISFINTFNILTIPRLTEYLQMLLTLRKKYGMRIVDPIQSNNSDELFDVPKRQRIWFDTPFLQFPNWLSIQNLSRYPAYIEIMEQALEFMRQNKSDDNYYKTYTGFKDHEIVKLERNIMWAKSGATEVSDEQFAHNQTKFYETTIQLDKRRNLDFSKTFPELKEWWIDCTTQFGRTDE